MKLVLFALSSLFLSAAQAKTAGVYEVPSNTQADYAQQACAKANEGINPGDPNALRIGCYDSNYVPLDTVEGLDVINYAVKLDSALEDPNIFAKTSATNGTGSKGRKGSQSAPTDR